MKPPIALALVFATLPALAQQQTGVSHPPDSQVEDLPLAAPSRSAKPSAAMPEETPLPAPAPDAYQPYRGSAAPLHTRTETPVDPDAGIVTFVPRESGVTLHTRTGAPQDPDAGIVTSVPRRPNELPLGTAFRIRLRDEIATESTQSNTPFTAELAENVVNEGRVVLPAGSTVEGTITQVRGGTRIRGAALIHLQAQAVILPDGTRIPLRAAVIDTDQYANTRVDEEGNILRKDHVGATLAAMSLTTGGAAAAGAVIGGGVGALVGAGVGAGLSTVWWLKQDRQAHLPKDTLIVLGLTEPLAIRPLVSEPNFSATPYAESNRSGMAAAQVPAAPAYVAPQSFVPTN